MKKYQKTIMMTNKEKNQKILKKSNKKINKKTNKMIMK